MHFVRNVLTVRTLLRTYVVIGYVVRNVAHEMHGRDYIWCVSCHGPIHATVPLLAASQLVFLSLPLVPLCGGVYPRVAGPKVQVDAQCSQFPVKFKLTVAQSSSWGAQNVTQSVHTYWSAPKRKTELEMGKISSIRKLSYVPLTPPIN